MKACLIGCGGISACHFYAMESLGKEAVELVGVADIIPERAEKAAAKYSCSAYTDYIEMLDAEKPDVVHVCTPHYLHVPMAVSALSRGINVVLEKPCAITPDGIKELIEAEKNSDAKLAVCFQNRYNNAAVYAKKLTDSGSYGKVTGVDAVIKWRRDENYYNADAWRGTKAQEGGGVMINQAIHTHDLMKYITGKETYSVEGTVRNFHLKDTIEVEDTASVFFEFTDGTRGVYYATNASANSMNPIIDIHFEKHTVRVEGDYVFEITGDKMKLIYSGDNEDADKVGKVEWGSGHMKLIRDFYSCIKDGRDFMIDSVSASKAVADLLAAYESSATGQKIIIEDFLNRR